VQWIQEIAIAHWESLAPRHYRDACIWVVTRHEIDYLRNVGPGEQVTGRTWVAEPPRGARFDRHVAFVDEKGSCCVRAKTTWAIIDAAARRPIRVPAELASLFLEQAAPG
jgi:acyl-CoA thioester hydrolase